MDTSDILLEVILTAPSRKRNNTPSCSTPLKSSTYRKIPKISPGAYIFQRLFLRGLYSEGLIYGGKFAFQNRLGKSIVGRKFTVFALFYFVFEGNFPSTSPQGAYIWRDDLTEGFLGYRFGGLIHGGACFRNFTGICHSFTLTRSL